MGAAPAGGSIAPRTAARCAASSESPRRYFCARDFSVASFTFPVGAISVHGVNGLWGTLACGLFNAEAVLKTADSSTGLFYGGGFNQFISQVIGAGTAFIWAFGIGMVLFTVIKKTMGLRVSKEEEMKGLDITEHGTEAYSGFQIFTNQ